MLVLLLLLCFNLLNAADESKQEVTGRAPLSERDVELLFNRMVGSTAGRDALRHHTRSSTASDSVYRDRVERMASVSGSTIDWFFREYAVQSDATAARVRTIFRNFYNEQQQQPIGQYEAFFVQAISVIHASGVLGELYRGSPLPVRPVSPILAADDALVLPWAIPVDVEDQGTDSEGEEADAPQRITPRTPEGLIAAIMTPPIAALRTPRTPQGPQLNVTPDCGHPRDEEDPDGQPPLKRARLEESPETPDWLRNFRWSSPGDDYDDQNDGHSLFVQ